MMLSDVAVRRPVFAAVAAIVLCVIGAAAFFFLPVRELPDVDPPVVSVSTSYAGASAEVIENRITEPVEQQIAGIQGVDRITSSSRDGRSNVTIEFSLDRNIDDAANDVRDRVARVVGRLPEQADPPEVSKADSDSSPILILFLRSSSMSRLELTDYADRYLVDRLATVPGVAQAQIFGEQRYAMRIWLNAEAMAARGITVTQVENALNSQNVELPAGALESTDKDYTVRVARTYARAEDFAQLPIGTTGTAAAAVSNNNANSTTLASTSGAVGAIQGQGRYVTRLGDIARVEEAAAEPRRLFRGNGLDQVGLGVTRQAQSNDLAISDGVKKLLEEIRPSLPPGTQLEIGVDNSVFTSHAIDEVWITIGISMVLVALVNFIFLGSFRAALIPSIVAPICLLATFIVLAPLGFSLNLLTLLALVLAIGLVVDDAIVVTENIQRRLDLGEPPLVAAERGARQVFFAVVATTVVLLAVFAPLLFLPGYVGRLFVELAAAIAAAVAFSAFLALTLSPMLASKILKPAANNGWLAHRVDRAMDTLKESYANSLGLMVGSRLAVVAVGGLILLVAGAAVAMFMTLPSELVPGEDRGRVQVRVAAPEGAGFDYTKKIMMGLEPVLAEYKANGEASIYQFGSPGFGGGSFNSGNATLVLEDWSKRKRSSDEIAQELNGKLRGQTGAQVNASVPGAFQRGGGGGGNSNSVEMIVTGAEYEDIYRWLQPVLAASQDFAGFSRPRLNYEPNAPRLLVDVDPEKAAGLGVSAQEIGRTLETMFGSRRATTYIKGGQEYDVILQTDRANRAGVSDLETLYVATGAGVLVPLSSVVRTDTSGDTPDRRRLDRQRAISLQADLTPGTTIADAVAFLNAQVAEQPQGVVNIQWGGAARDQQEAGSAVGAAFGLALLLVFLVLAAQFESWITPAVIMLTVPLAAAGGLFGLFMAGSSLNIYSQIGLIILIGVAAKNGILIVEFANQLRDQGRSITEAIIESSSLRLRPIIMTSIATAFGALPLVLWQGAGAGSRQTIGVVIFAGALFATLLTLFVVPVIYGALARFTKSPEWTARKIEEWEAQEATSGQPRAE
jgi:multidrug efflux pump